MRKPQRSPLTLEQQVTDYLSDQILDQRLRPGQHIVAENLAQALGVSRLPVREALRNLAGNGLVELRPHRGAFVTMIDVDRVDMLIELIEVRCLLEPRAAALAATRHDKLDLTSLDAIVSRGVEATRQGQRSTANLAHHRFLRAIAAMARHEMLETTLAPLHHRTLLAFATVALKVDPSGWEVHRGVRDAVAARDADTAHSLTRHHLDQVLAALHARDNVVPAVVGPRRNHVPHRRSSTSSR